MNCIPWLKSKWRRRNFIKIEPEAEVEAEEEPEPILVFSKEMSKFSIGDLTDSESESESESVTM
jgi:hypothetical protein